MKIFRGRDTSAGPTADPAPVGARMEETAARHLAAAGLEIVEQNFRTRSGEIDLIARDGAMLVFVEVRFRRSRAYGGAAASVDRRKQQKLLAAAASYLQQKRLDCPCRFDVIAIEGRDGEQSVDWIKSAFEA
ncbi:MULTISPECIES: YraN family protein [Microbulbifer]|nr:MULTISPECIES: YraN family protein [Microbulbifer]